MPEIDQNVDRLPACAILTCAVLEDEVRHFARGLPHIVHLELLPQGLHNEPVRLREELQKAVNRAEQNPAVEAIVLGYGLCSRGIEDVVTTRVPLVIARAHDCITLLLGSRHAYADYVARYPGTYWYSPGWNRHHLAPGQKRYDTLRQKYVDQFGEEDADYLMEQEQGWFQAYNRATYVDLGVGVTDEDLQYTRACAQWLQWNYDHQKGDPALMRALLNGHWDEKDFVILRPGHTFRMTADERIIEAVPLTVHGKQID